MTRQDAIDRIRESIARGTKTPTVGADRDRYVEEQAANLVGAVIEPCSVIVVGEANSYGVFEALRSERVIAVARLGDRWLLYRPARNEFCLAYGPDVDHLNLWGFSSPDALAEWLG